MCCLSWMPPYQGPGHGSGTLALTSELSLEDQSVGETLRGGRRSRLTACCVVVPIGRTHRSVDFNHLCGRRGARRRPCEQEGAMSDELLIIEDDVMLGIELKRHFERGGWRTRFVRSLGEAEPFVFGAGYEGLVVLSDLHLPDGNALDLLERARAQGDKREWVFLTGFGEAPDAERAKGLGAFDFLTKPMDRERLDRILAAARRGARAQRRIADETSQQRTRYSPPA